VCVCARSVCEFAVLLFCVGLIKGVDVTEEATRLQEVG
jgi:hypothetical protein